MGRRSAIALLILLAPVAILAVARRLSPRALPAFAWALALGLATALAMFLWIPFGGRWDDFLFYFVYVPVTGLAICVVTAVVAGIATGGGVLRAIGASLLAFGSAVACELGLLALFVALLGSSLPPVTFTVALVFVLGSTYVAAAGATVGACLARRL